MLRASFQLFCSDIWQRSDPHRRKPARAPRKNCHAQRRSLKNPIREPDSRILAPLDPQRPLIFQHVDRFGGNLMLCEPRLFSSRGQAPAAARMPQKKCLVKSMKFVHVTPYGILANPGAPTPKKKQLNHNKGVHGKLCCFMCFSVF